MFNFKKCIQVDETLHICYSRCPLSNAIKLLLLQDIIIILCAITQLMYVEMANNCFKKYSEVGSQYQCTEQSVCVCVCVWYRHCMHLVYILLRKLQLHNLLPEHAHVQQHEQGVPPLCCPSLADETAASGGHPLLQQTASS